MLQNPTSGAALGSRARLKAYSAENLPQRGRQPPPCALPPLPGISHPPLCLLGGGDFCSANHHDPQGHLWRVRRTFPSAGPPAANVFRAPLLSWERSRALLGAPHRRLSSPGPRLFLSASPSRPPPRSTSAHFSPSQGKPPYLPVPHFGKYGHRGSALLATGPRRAWAVGLGRARSLESLRQILLFYLLTNISPGHKELGCYLPTHAR